MFNMFMNETSHIGPSKRQVISCSHLHSAFPHQLLSLTHKKQPVILLRKQKAYSSLRALTSESSSIILNKSHEKLHHISEYKNEFVKQHLFKSGYLERSPYESLHISCCYRNNQAELYKLLIIKCMRIQYRYKMSHFVILRSNVSSRPNVT